MAATRTAAATGGVFGIAPSFGRWSAHTTETYASDDDSANGFACFWMRGVGGILHALTKFEAAGLLICFLRNRFVNVRSHSSLLLAQRLDPFKFTEAGLRMLRALRSR